MLKNYFNKELLNEKLNNILNEVVGDPYQTASIKGILNQFKIWEKEFNLILLVLV